MIEENSMQIHPTAIIHPDSELATDISVGPYAVIDDDVRIGNGCRIHAHAHIASCTTIGERCEIYPYASIGTAPQDLKFDGRRTETIIGSGNVIREFVTINRGSVGGDEVTRIGDDSYFMAYSHVAHDCIIGNHVIMANAATLAGHVTVYDHATLGGLSAVHQFVRIGTHAFIGGKTGIPKDIPPYVLASGERAKLYGINRVGLKRKNFPESVLKALKECYRIVLRNDTPLEEALEVAESRFGDVEEVRIFVDFCRNSERGITRRNAGKIVP
jgi:UDP-N-acetylglucosamine acyltransferase